MLIDKAQVKPKKRILIVGDKLLLGAGVEYLLSREDGLDLVGIDPCDELTLGEIIEHVQPQVVVVDEAMSQANSLDLLSLLKKPLNFKLMVVSADSDLIEVYERQQFLVTQPADLIHIMHKNILQNPYPGNSTGF
jgi:DNA-binding NarL/FixJ family response regulator